MHSAVSAELVAAGGSGSYGGAGGNPFEGFDFSQFGGGGGFSSFFENLFGGRGRSQQSADGFGSAFGGFNGSDGYGSGFNGAGTELVLISVLVVVAAVAARMVVPITAK